MVNLIKQSHFGYLRQHWSKHSLTSDVEVCHDILSQFLVKFVCSNRLLKLALPLVRTHGFTREALSRSVLSLPADEVHTEPLSDTAISALFGHGDDARRTLIKAWLGDGLRHMGSIPGVERSATPLLALDSETSRTGTETKATVRDVLRARLEYNEPALPYLPEVRFYSFLCIDYVCSFM